jgi:hypothetical protein
MDNTAAERAWKWIFEFNVKEIDGELVLDEANSKLFDQKLKWLVENETDDNILRTLAVLIQNVPVPKTQGEGRMLFESRFGKQIIDGPRGGPWRSGFEQPNWAATMKKPNQKVDK